LIDSVPLREDTRTGAWQVIHPQAKSGDYYQYQLSLYHPARQKVETLLVTDPYALSLSTNSSFSQVIDLNALATQPDGWLAQANIALAAPEEHILYELHIRDFSASDHTLADNSNRGKYAAFSEPNSAGINHLKQLQRSGINTIHLLPTFDIGTINEEPAQAIDLQDPLSKVCQQVPELTLCHSTNLSSRLIEVLNQLPTDSAQTQAIISAIRAQDNYNWGYDPLHFTVPEGSYAKNPQGFARIKEFRQMILSLHRLGFRVVMDVVYNHTNAAGLAHNSVLDKIVPNYYHRLHPLSGAIEQSTCCDNTATERQMMAKLMTDSLLVWARDYKIDGFRFDLMGHQPKSLMLAAREAVRQVDPDSYFYGEGWNFGEVANNQRFTQASQLNLAGTEIGTFSDRLRDAVRGPGIGVSGVAIRASQGIGNGLLTLPNEQPQSQSTREQYLHLMDQLRIGLAGNLANFPLLNHAGVWLQGKDIPYADQPTGYAFDPADTINYVSKHDNQTLWDNNQYRNAFELSTEQRVRLHIQSLAYPLFAQGIPFLQMGAELLRSKSFLRDSYDYGDWFNRVDFTMQHNNYQVGLPPAEKDQENWPLIQSVLAGNQGRDRVNTEQIAFTNAVFNELVQIRRSSPLFRLRTNQQILNSVKFLNTGPQQQTGLILMLLDDSHGSVPVDHQWQQVLVLFNANNSEQTFHYADADKFSLHPLQQHSVDAKVSNSRATATKFVVPALTTSVFVRPRTTPKP
jgi:pullulanase